MSPLDYIKAFAAFIPVAESVVDAFVSDHPELRDPPPVAAKAEIDSEFNRKLDKRFPHSER